MFIGWGIAAVVWFAGLWTYGIIAGAGETAPEARH
jgi:hypothetical protein